MTAVEDRIRATLTAVADAAPVPPVPDELVAPDELAVRRGTVVPLRRRRALAAVGAGVAAALVAGAVTGVVLVRGGSTAAPAAATPQLRGTDLSGRPVDVPTTGHVTVVTVWGAWCGPCFGQAPALAQAAATLAGTGVVFAGIDTRDTDAAARRFVAERHWPGVQVADHDGSLAAAWGALAPPTTILIGPDGAVFQRIPGVVRADELLDYVRKILPHSGCETESTIDPATRPELVWTVAGVPDGAETSMSRACGAAAAPPAPGLALIRWSTGGNYTAAVAVFADTTAAERQVLPSDAHWEPTAVAGRTATLATAAGTRLAVRFATAGKPWLVTSSGLTASQLTQLSGQLSLSASGSPQLAAGAGWTDVTATAQSPSSVTTYQVLWSVHRSPTQTSGSVDDSLIVSDADPWLTPATASWYDDPGHLTFPAFRGHQAAEEGGRLTWEVRPGVWLTVDAALADRVAPAQP